MNEETGYTTPPPPGGGFSFYIHTRGVAELIFIKICAITLSDPTGLVRTIFNERSRKMGTPETFVATLIIAILAGALTFIIVDQVLAHPLSCRRWNQSRTAYDRETLSIAAYILISFSIAVALLLFEVLPLLPNNFIYLQTLLSDISVYF